MRVEVHWAKDAVEVFNVDSTAKVNELSARLFAGVLNEQASLPAEVSRRTKVVQVNQVGEKNEAQGR